MSRNMVAFGQGMELRARGSRTSRFSPKRSLLHTPTCV